MTWNVPGSVTVQTQGSFGWSILNDHPQDSSAQLSPPPGQTINGDATLTLNFGSYSGVGGFQAYIDNNGTGIIHENAVVTANVNGDVNTDGKILVDIFDTGFTNLTTTFFGPSQIDGNAIVTLQARNINTTSTASGTPGAYLAMALEAAIYPNAAGTIGGDAIVNVAATQDINAAGSALFLIANGNYQNLGPGMIGGTLELM